MAHIHGYKKLTRIDIPGAARFITFSCHQQRPSVGIDSARSAFVGPFIDFAASARIELHASNSTHGCSSRTMSSCC
jgi:hypothetical protein